MSYSITQFWYILEQLIPFDLSKKIKNLKHHGSITKEVQAQTLPWINSEVLRKKYRLPLGYDGKGEPIEYNYRIYLGVFPLELIFKFLQSLPKPISPWFDEETSTTTSLSCFVSFMINHKGLLVDETLNVSAVPWGLKQVSFALRQKKKLSLDGWTQQYREHTSHLNSIFSSYASAYAEANHKVSVSELFTLLKELCYEKSQWFPESSQLTYLGYYSIERSKSEDNSNTDILNSFYLKDLEVISEKLRNNQSNLTLKQYLSGGSPQKYSVEDLSFLQEYLSPRYLPSGRWPSPPTHTLSLQQQCAVNLSLNLLKNRGGLFSVNGPPGTGKTTLLKDLIAEVIVERARLLTVYKNPEGAFSNSGKVYRPSPSITGYEIVVASSNNGAVENVTAELPGIEAIAPQYRGHSAYLRKTAQSVTENSSQYSPNGNGSTSKNNSSEHEQEMVWGLIAAVLGNKKNCNNFVQGFWFDKVHSIRAVLKGEDLRGLDDNSVKLTPQQKWKGACENFERCSLLVEKIRSQRQSYVTMLNEEEPVHREYQQAYSYLQQQTVLLATSIAKADQSKQKWFVACEALSQQKEYLSSIKENKPSLLKRLLNSNSSKRYEKTLNEAEQELEQLEKQKDYFEEIYTQADSERFQTEKLHELAINTVKKLEQKLETIQKTLALLKKERGSLLADAEWWERSRDEIQLTAPWIDEQLNEARTQLFLAALEVHEQFIRNASKPFMKNLARWVDLINGKSGDLTDSEILYLWQSFFLVLPVVSTTFASFGRLFERLGTDSIGWLLIDEAGQGIPQASVGALHRSRRAVVVGDPLQIKPVFTLDPAIVEGLRQTFGLSEYWCPDKASIQTLCDRANPYGTMLETETSPIWIGCPLWVHRRCCDPMATIANTIAYNGQMVVATKPPSGKNFVLGESGWFDVSGTCSGRHWVPDQGELVLRVLKRVIDAENQLPSLFIISPFRSVATEMRQLLKQKQSSWAANVGDVETWLNKSVGTVHTFQGKEADVVILVLGTDEKSRGAAQWAASEPNILNVAVTRAKYWFYVAGDKRLWSKLPYFSTASKVLENKPIDFYTF